MNYEPGNAWSGSRGMEEDKFGWWMAILTHFICAACSPWAPDSGQMQIWRQSSCYTVDHKATSLAVVFQCLARGNLSTCWAYMSLFTSWDFPSCDPSVTLQLPASLTIRQLLPNTEHLSHLCFTKAKFDYVTIAKVKEEDWWTTSAGEQSEPMFPSGTADQFRSNKAIWVSVIVPIFLKQDSKAISMRLYSGTVVLWD